MIVVATSPALDNTLELFWLKLKIWLGRRLVAGDLALTGEPAEGSIDAGLFEPSARALNRSRPPPHLPFPAMGYSARYHVASLAAVFLALAIGILIGAEFGDDVVSGARRTSRRASRRPRDRPRAAPTSSPPSSAGRTTSPSGSTRRWSRSASPAAASACSALGGLPDGVSSDIEDALDAERRRG